MLFDLAETDQRKIDLRARICVVGGGAVGLVLATALKKSGIDVLLLEGGGAGMETGTQDLQAGASVGHPFTNIGVGRYRVLGGSTAYWGGQVLPFDAFVLGEREWLGHSAWPVEQGAMDRYCARAYRYLGLHDTVLDDAEVWRQLEIPSPDLGPALEVVLTRWLRTRNFAKLFAPLLRAEDGPRVMLHANATALELAPDGERVHAIVARSLNGRTARVSADAFVVANGTLEIVRLLKQPLADGTEPPWAGAKWLGRPLIDHLDCTAGTVAVTDYRRFHDLFANIYLGGLKYYPKIRLSRKLQRAEGLVDVAAQFLYRTKFTEHLEYIKMFLRSVTEGGAMTPLRRFPGHARAVLATALPLAVRYFRDRRSFKPRDAKVSLVLYCEQLPCERSVVGLGTENDALGMKRLEVDWNIEGTELRSMRRFARIVKDSLEARGLARIDLDPRLDAGDPSFLSEIHDAVHQMGTARMASNSSDGVVDPNLRVFGTTNLYVAGAAVFPSSGFANPTFTAVALALRLVDHLASVDVHQAA